MTRKRPHEPGWHFSRRDLNRCGADGKRLYLTAEDASRYFGVSLHTILEWDKLGVVPMHRLGGRIYVNRDEVAAYWAMFQTKR
jgi:excisionase family DNA binding protein